MHRHAETRILPYSPKQLFDLVADIGRYPEFLPWCIAARITGREAGVVWADLVVGKGPFREAFTSKVTLEDGNGSPPTIDVEYVKGPLRRMSNHWEFRPAEAGTELRFVVEFEFRSGLLNRVMGTVFDDAVHRMVGAFERRAQVLYGTEAIKG